MKVMCTDVTSPRSDFPHKKPHGITAGKVYEVAMIEGDKYTIINDEFKMARYNQYRFDVVDNSDIPSLRKNFNPLTTQMRTEIKQLKKHVKELERPKVEQMSELPDWIHKMVDESSMAESPDQCFETLAMITRMINKDRGYS